jgi:beta-glucanase (GH16 family)
MMNPRIRPARRVFASNAKIWLAAAAVVVLFVVAMTVAVLRAGDDRPDGVAVGRTGDGPPPATGTAPREGDGPPLPVGQNDGWQMQFSDEFDGASLDSDRWTDQSGAEADEGRGNKGNKQLEWNQAANCSVGSGELTMTARREAVTSSSGERYDWTSCLISSTPAYGFQFGYIEERAILPKQRGFWPAFWTWQAPHENRYIETDVYEFYSQDRRRLDLTQHSGSKGNCKPTLSFDPADDWHTYGAAIEPSGTTWYIDGVEVCRTPATSDGVTNIVSNLAVFATAPPGDGTTEAVKRVDYIRAWQRP